MGRDPYVHDGRRVPSVTTILGKYKDPGPLTYWSWNVCYQVLLEAHEKLSKVVYGPTSSKAAIAEWLKSKPLDRANYRNVSKDACDAGTIAHECVEAYIVSLGSKPIPTSIFSILKLYDVSKEIAASAVNALKAFKAWSQQVKFAVIACELRLIHEQDLYGGMIDCVAEVDGKTVIFDWKTSKDIYYEYVMQVAAYRELWNQKGKHPISESHIVRFDKKTAGFEHRLVTQDELDDANKAFQGLLTAYKIQHGD